MSLFKLTIGISLLLGLATSLHGQVTIYADELTNNSSTGIASGNVSGSGASSQINLSSGRNNQVIWEFSDLTLANEGDFISATMTVVFDSDIATNNTLFIVRLGDSTTGYYNSVSFDMTGGTNEGLFSTSLANNQGRFDILQPGTIARTFTFTSTRNASANGLNIAVSGDPFIDEAGNSANADVSNLPLSNNYDQITFRFAGGSSGGDWNTPITATVTDFSITSNIPEPGTYALVFAVAALGIVVLRRSRC